MIFANSYLSEIVAHVFDDRAETTLMIRLAVPFVIAEANDASGPIGDRITSRGVNDSIIKHRGDTMQVEISVIRDICPKYSHSIEQRKALENTVRLTIEIMRIRIFTVVLEVILS